MSAHAYEVIHMLGVFMVVLAFGGVLLHALNGGTRETNRSRKHAAMFHGIGLLIILVSSFGMLARLKVGFPGWVVAKLVIWLLFGGLLMLPARKPETARWLWLLLPLLGATAAWLGVYKPF